MPTAALAGPQATTTLIDMVGCQNLATHLLTFLPTTDGLRLGAACSTTKPLIDAAIIAVTLNGHRGLPTTAQALATRFPLLADLTLHLKKRYYS